MDLIEKLKQYSAAPSPPRQEPDAATESLCRHLGGQVVDDRYPAVIRIIRQYSFASFLPDQEKKIFTQVHLPLLTRNEFSTPVPMEKMVLFDLETTGLAGGTGTYPFLLGFGVFSGQGIEIRQYFLPDYGRESITYSDLLTCFDGKEILVSFNGKSFDLPLLNTRCALNRFRNPFSTFRHLDLLHLARRIWKSRLESCSLENIENQIFQFRRENDISGHLIPQVYFDFVRTGNIQDMIRVIDHNQQDIITLGRLILHLNWLEQVNNYKVIHELELQNLCNLAISNLDLSKSSLLLDRLREKTRTPSNLTLTAYSLLLKRYGRWDEAVRIWEELIRTGQNTLFALEELAKYYEHQVVDLPRAKMYAERALGYVDVLDELEMNVHQSRRDDFLYRLRRIQRKLKRDEVLPG